jgi:SAM-dependent methyltransferase
MDTAYDRVPYPTGIYSQTHCRRLAAMARLFGVNAPDVRTCRVLEIGCGEGSNLIGMAVDLPESQFVGIDISQPAIDRAIELAANAGVENITFRQGDVMELIGRPASATTSSRTESSPGCRVRSRKRSSNCASGCLRQPASLHQLLDVPGLAHTEMVAEMMRFHTVGVDDPTCSQGGTRVAPGRCAYPGSENPYATIILSEVERLAQRNRSATFHDELGTETKPLLFEEFVKRLRPYSLQFMAEGGFSTMVYDDLPAEASSALDEIRDDAVRREQYLDFFKLRRLRESLVCRADLTVLPEASTGAFDVSTSECRWLRRLRPITQRNRRSSLPDSGTCLLRVAQPFVKAAIAALCDAWPSRLSFDQTLEAAQLRLHVPSRTPRSYCRSYC